MRVIDSAGETIGWVQNRAGVPINWHAEYAALGFVRLDRDLALLPDGVDRDALRAGLEAHAWLEFAPSERVAIGEGHQARVAAALATLGL